MHLTRIVMHLTRSETIYHPLIRHVAIFAPISRQMVYKRLGARCSLNGQDIGSLESYKVFSSIVIKYVRA